MIAVQLQVIAVQLQVIAVLLQVIPQRSLHQRYLRQIRILLADYCTPMYVIPQWSLRLAILLTSYYIPDAGDRSRYLRLVSQPAILCRCPPMFLRSYSICAANRQRQLRLHTCGDGIAVYIVLSMFETVYFALKNRCEKHCFILISVLYRNTGLLYGD